MRNLKIVFALVFATFFFLTSCQKEAVENLDATTTPSTELNVPHTDEQEFNGKVIAYPKELPAKDLDLSLEVTPLEKAAAQDRNSTIYITLGDDPVKIDIDCGQTIRSSTKGNDNLFRNSTYNQLGVGANLNGGDQVYNFYVAQTDMVSIDLSDTRENLAMFLYKGEYDIQRGRISLRYIRDYTTSTSRWGDHLGPIQLTAGNYILVVDSAPNRESDYTLTIDCANPPPCDDMEDYYLGNISPQSAKWEKWANNSGDGVVRANGGGQYLKIKENTNGRQADLLYKFGRKNRDSYTLSMDMWIFRGKSGYFNIQKQLKYEWGGQVYFHGNGTGEVKINGRSIGFSYPQNTWANVTIDFDFDRNTTQLRINNQRKATWSIREHSQGANGSYQIEAVNFYTNANNSEMFIDNVCFEQN